MEVKVGVQMVTRELVLETGESAQDIERALTEALADDTVLTLKDSKGKILLIPADKIAYLELGTVEQRKIGFGAS